MPDTTTSQADMHRKAIADLWGSDYQVGDSALDFEEYNKFLDGKITIADSVGFLANSGELQPATKPHQADTILWGLANGRGLIASSFGLGKSHQTIEMLRLIHER